MSTYSTPMPSSEVASYVAYSRVSRQSQAAGHISLSTQEDMMRRHAEISGAVIVGSFEDVYTGRESAQCRPGLRRALDLCASTGASLLVARVDRLARSLDVVELLERDGVEVVSLEEGLVSREGRLGALLLKAEAYSRALSENSRAAAKRRKSAGLQLGNLQNLEASRGRGTLNNKARAGAKVNALAGLLRDHPVLLEMSHRRRAELLNEMGVFNARTLHGVPVPWTAGALRKPYKAALAQLREEEAPPLS